ncbi:hypothetical protein [Streptomyces sp. NPDC002088]|uniref:hypothetical protein n=1 Tax=Streptomyces sp. NPDC002088 TaxID=3154665 RepID=UPI0033198237
MFTNYADAASLAIGLVLPAVVALLTRPSTNATVKGTAHAVLSIATGALAVYQANPSKGYIVPALVAGLLAWLSGTAFYHSLLKKYSWFAWLQNALVRDKVSGLHIGGVPVAEVYEQARVAEDAVKDEEAAEVVGQVVQSAKKAI